MQEVLNLQTSDTVERILSEEVFEVTSDPEQPTPDQLAPQPQPQTVGGVDPNTGTHQHTHVVQPQPVQPQAAAQPQPVMQPQPMTTQHHPSGAMMSDVAIPAQPPGAAFGATAFNPAAPPVEQTQPVVSSAFTTHPPSTTHQVNPPTADIRPITQPVTTNGTGQPMLSPEQQEIARLKAELAAASAKPQRATRRRTTPVTPTGQQPQVQVQPPVQQPQDQPLPFTSHAQPPVTEGEDDGDAPPDLDSRIDSLLGGGDKS
jgi:hypothetical protein